MNHGRLLPPDVRNDDNLLGVKQNEGNIRVIRDMNEITNAHLTEKDITPSEANWNIISAFALTFNGYAHWGSAQKCGKIANDSVSAWQEKKILPPSLTDLRTCLFFEQRRWHHFGYDPDKETMIYIHALVEAIRSKIQTGERD